MRLLILGGNKFLGKELVRQALQQNHELTIISLDSPEFPNEVDWINVNRNNYDDLRFALEGKEFDCIIDNIAYNRGQVTKFLSIVKDKTKRYVLTSTIDTYYGKNELRPTDEDLDQNLNTEGFGTSRWENYIVGKRTLEKELRGDPSTIEKVIVRPCNVVGPNDNVVKGDFARSLYYPAKIIDNGPVIIYHTDTEVFSLVYVKDVASALLLVATHPDAANQTFNIVGDTVWTTESYLQKLINASGSKSKIVRLHQKALIDGGLLADQSSVWPSTYGFIAHLHKLNLFDNSRLKALGWKNSPDDEMLRSIFENMDGIKNVQAHIKDKRELEIKLGQQHIEDYSTFVEGNCTAPLSSIAIGTHRGENTDETDDQYRLSITESVLRKINVIDTAINYRNTRSEKVVGEVIRNLITENHIKRNDVFVITKGGYINKPCGFPLLNTNEINNGNSVRSCYLKWSLNESYKNLKLKTIDLFLIHNPEIALNYLSKQEFYRILIDNFAMLEHEVDRGRIASYGLATWAGLISKPNAPTYLDLNQVLECAKIAAGTKDHHLTSIELPLNVIRHFALTRTNQPLDGNLVTVMEFARAKGLKVFTSNSALYGESSDDIESRLRLNSTLTIPEQNILFAKSIPGVTSAIVGMRRIENVESAIRVLGTNYIDSQKLDSIIKLCKFKTKE
jgi:nucleoside-diphosphate-sugar epimerase/aryl-alcohol dehydrogenase-like predicted oxidoreductase